MAKAKERITVMLPHDLVTRLKVRAAQNRTSHSEVIERALVQLLGESYDVKFPPNFVKHL